MQTANRPTGREAFRIAMQASSERMQYFVFASAAANHGMHWAACFARSYGVSLEQCLRMARAYHRIGYWI